MEITINYGNLKDYEINETKEKVRAIIVSPDNKILAANYSGVLLLPGGSIDNNETKENALLRELKEELGTPYNDNELEYLFSLKFYQKNYPKRNGLTLNRKIVNYYYIVPFKSINYDNQTLTEKELNNKFNLHFLSIDEISEYLQNINTDNPRFSYFKEEMEIILSNIIKSKEKVYKK